MDKDGFHAIKVLVVVDSDVVVSVAFKPAEGEGTDIDVGWCCDSCLLGADAALNGAIDAVRFQLWKSGLAGKAPAGISSLEEKPPF